MCFWGRLEIRGIDFRSMLICVLTSCFLFRLEGARIRLTVEKRRHFLDGFVSEYNRFNGIVKCDCFAEFNRIKWWGLMGMDKKSDKDCVEISNAVLSKTK